MIVDGFSSLALALALELAIGAAVRLTCSNGHQFSLGKKFSGQLALSLPHELELPGRRLFDCRGEADVCFSNYYSIRQLLRWSFVHRQLADVSHVALAPRLVDTLFRVSDK